MAHISDITNNIPHSKATLYEVDEIAENYKLVVTADDGYKFDGAILFNYTDQNGDYSEDILKVSEDGKTASITNNEYYPMYGEELTGNTVGSETTVTYKMTVDVSNLTVNGAKDVYAEDDVINITLKPLEGYVIKGVPYLHYNDDNGDPVEIQFTISGDEASLVKPISDLTDNVSGNPLTIYGEGEKSAPVESNKGLVNIYAVTMQQLSEFAKTRFFRTTDSTTGATLEQIDLGIYVKGVRQAFYPVNTSGTPHIVCGNYDTGVTVLNVDDTVIDIDLGSVEIPFNNGNTTDYNSALTVFLPFVGFKNLPVNIIGHTIKIICSVDVENGKGVYKLFNDGDLFDTLECDPNYNIVFRTSDGVTFDNDSDSKYLYGLKPFVRYSWYEDKTTGRNNTDKLKTVSDLTGYNKVDDVINLSSNGKTLEEYNEIISILKNGFSL